MDIPQAVFLLGIAALAALLLYALWRWRKQAVRDIGFSGQSLDQDSHTPAIPVSVDLQVQELIARDKNIQALKLVLEHSNGDMRQARAYLEKIVRQSDEISSAPTMHLPEPPLGFPPHVMAEVGALMSQERKIQAIKLIREHTGWDLKRSKEFVERLP